MMVLIHFQIMLIENKEESVKRAKTRVEKLELNNVLIYKVRIAAHHICICFCCKIM